MTEPITHVKAIRAIEQRIWDAAFGHKEANWLALGAAISDFHELVMELWPKT